MGGRKRKGETEERKKGRGEVGRGEREGGREERREGEREGARKERRKGKKESQQSIRELWDYARCSNTCILIVPGERKNTWLEKILKE